MCNDWMDKYEFRRLALRHLVSSMGHGGQARVAEEIGKAPDYIGRLLYPAGKKGKKRIGEDTVEILSAKFPGWIDIDLSDVGENIFTSKRRSERERLIQKIVALLRETDSEGLDVVLHSATLMYEKYPIAQQTQSSQ